MNECLLVAQIRCELQAGMANPRSAKAVISGKARLVRVRGKVKSLGAL